MTWSCNPAIWRHVHGEFEIVLLKTVPVMGRGEEARRGERKGGEGIGRRGKEKRAM